MELTLTTWQRLQLLMLMSQTQGDLRTINKALKLIDILELTSEEQDEIGLIQTATGFTWNRGDKTWKIEVQDDNLVTFLKERVKAKQDWPAHRDVLDLCSQLGIDLDKEET